MKVQYFTTTDFAQLSPLSTIRETLEAFLCKRVDIACVMKNDTLIGIITKYSLYRLLLHNTSLDQSIQKAIKRQIISIKKDMTLYEAKDIMVDGKVSHAVVVDENEKVYGIMSKSDLIRGIMSEAQNVANLMQSLVENLQDAIISVDENLRITTFNQAAKLLFGFEDRMIGVPVHQTLPTFTKEFMHCLTSGESMEAKRMSLAKNKVIASFIPIRQLSKTTGTMVVLRDVTSFESIANELETTKQLKKILDSAIEFAYDAVIVTDHTGKITLTNEGFLELYNYQANTDILGKEISIVAPEIPSHQSLEHQKIVKGELININNQSCILTQAPIMKGQNIIGAMYKIMYRQLDVWKDLLSQMEQLENELTYYRGELIKITNEDDPFTHIISNHPTMKKLKNEAFIAAQSFSTVLITGESGTGKELIAEGIHTSSGRHGRYIKVNCAAIPADLLESEFFGYADGAFTGAKKGGKPGKFEMANQGTLFLDEIGDMPLQLQAKLLRVLQEKEFERIGDTKTTSVDVRIIAATNKDLAQLVKEDKFREDLLYRIHVIHLHVPSLRERIDDIPILCQHFINKIKKKTNKAISGVSSEVLRLFQHHQWPGNIRQLENVMERAFHFCQGNYIESFHLPPSFFETLTKKEEFAVSQQEVGIKNRQDQMNETDRNIILSALAKVNGNKTKAAELLGISRSTLYQKIKQYQITEARIFENSHK